MKKTLILLSLGSLYQYTHGVLYSRPACQRSVLKSIFLKPLLVSKQSEPVIETLPSSKSKLETMPPSTTDVLTLSQARLLLIAISAMYGTNFSCIKILDESLEPNLLALFRFSIAFMVFIPYVFKRDDIGLVKSGMSVGLFNSVGYFAQATALQTAAASNTAFICSLTALIVPILDIFFKNNNVVILKKLLPALLAIAGVGLLELGGEYTVNKGDLIALIQPLAFGYAYWKTEDLVKDCETRDQSLAFTGGMLLSVVISSFIWCALDIGLPAILHGDVSQTVSRIAAPLTSIKVLGSLLWTGVFTTAFTSFGEIVALKKLTAAEITVIFSTEPLWASLVASVFVHETFGLNSLAGAILVLLACLWSVKMSSSAQDHYY